MVPGNEVVGRPGGGERRGEIGRVVGVQRQELRGHRIEAGLGDHLAGKRRGHVSGPVGATRGAAYDGLRVVDRLPETGEGEIPVQLSCVGAETVA